MKISRFYGYPFWQVGRLTPVQIPVRKTASTMATIKLQKLETVKETRKKLFALENQMFYQTNICLLLA